MTILRPVALMLALMAAAVAAVAQPRALRWEGEHWYDQAGSRGPDLPPFGSGGACLGSGFGGRRGHYAIYRVRVEAPLPEAMLYIRYARQPQPGAEWELLLDREPTRQLTLESTGGWGHIRDAEWRLVAVPLGELQTGWREFELRSARAQSNTNFDCFVLGPPDLELPSSREAIEQLRAATLDRGQGGDRVDHSLSFETFAPVTDDPYYPAEEVDEREQAPLPRLVSLDGETATLQTPGGDQLTLRPGESAGGYMLLAITRDPLAAVLAQDFRRWGRFVFLCEQRTSELRRAVGDLSALDVEPQKYPPDYLQALLEAEADVLGDRVLADGDASFERVAGYLPDVWGYTPICAPGRADKPVVDADGSIGLLTGEYGAKRIEKPWFDPQAEFPRLRGSAARRGLLGGHLPAIDFGFYDPAAEQGWEQVAFSTDGPNGRTHLGLRGPDGDWRFFALGQARQEITGRVFFEALLALEQRWEGTLDAGLKLELPEPRLTDASYAALIHAWTTYAGDRPKYGLGYYAGDNHDGFPPTTLWMANACAEWGLFEPARRYLGHYLTHFVNDDGTFKYYGPAVAEYGQMLEVAVRLFRYTGDQAWWSEHLPALEATADHLVRLWRAARDQSEPGSPTYGVLFGSPEADTRQDVNHYFSGSAWAWRGLLELSRVLATREGRAGQAENLRTAAEGLRDDLLAAAHQALLPGDPPFLPPFPGMESPFPRMTADRVASYTNYRYWLETLSAGIGDDALTEAMIRYRRAHGGELLGMTRFSGQLDDWPLAHYSRALLEEDQAERYLLGLYGHLAHHQTRGTFTAYEQVGIRDLARRAYHADYCVPSQLTVPLLVRWMLAYEDRDADRLWLLRAVPRRWWEPGQEWGFEGAPTRWGPVSVQVKTSDKGARMVLDRPDGPEIILRLRCPAGRPVQKVLAGVAEHHFDPEREIISLPPAAGKLTIEALY